jgi:flagellar biosynthesis protein FlhB
MASKHEKTEKPTGWRLREARNKGNVPRSRELTINMTLFLNVLFFALFFPFMGHSLIGFMQHYFGRAGEIEITTSTLRTIAEHSFHFYLTLLGPLFIITVTAVFILTVAQGGFHFVISNLQLNFSKFNVIKGVRNIILSPEAAIELVKSFLKVMVIGAIAYSSIRHDTPLFLRLSSATLPTILSTVGKAILRLSLYIILFLLALSVADYMVSHFMYTRRLKMTKQEVKDEFKMHEGDPLIKQKVRAIRMQRAMRRMMAQVPKADVVITNPSHYAIALKYELKKMAAPKVLAKGQDLIAKRIKALAAEHNIPVVENPQLARALYAAVEVGSFIPADFFRPVAEILAYIYRVKGRKVSQ